MVALLWLLLPNLLTSLLVCDMFGNPGLIVGRVRVLIRGMTCWCINKVWHGLDFTVANDLDAAFHIIVITGSFPMLLGPET